MRRFGRETRRKKSRDNRGCPGIKRGSWQSQSRLRRLVVFSNRPAGKGIVKRALESKRVLGLRRGFGAPGIRGAQKGVLKRATSMIAFLLSIAFKIQVHRMRGGFDSRGPQV